jgi:nicotinamidase-related amidase
VRQAEPRFEQKGQHPLTEHYSVLRPEVTEVAGRRVGSFNEALYARLLSHDRVYIFGQARSHCVRWTLLDLRERILATEPALVRKLYVLEDATSPVPPPPLQPLPPALDFPRLAEEALALARECGMHVVRTTEPLD